MPFRAQRRQLANKNTTCFQVERILFNKPEPLHFTKKKRRNASFIKMLCFVTVNFYFTILYELHGKKKREGNRELFSMCISGSVAWSGSLVLVLGQPWLSCDSPELAVYP